jgi:molybdopterin-guanine dinucleotide biosynthesis protein A
MGQDKGLMPYKGKPLVEYVLEFLIPVCDEIVISSNSLDYLDFGHQTIPDIVPDIGPMGECFLS